MQHTLKVPVITIDDAFNSVFSEVEFERTERAGMFLTNRIDSKNFRLRESTAGYKSDWHVAGDPTLIIVQQGSLKITLQNGEERVFHPGEMFVAQDYLPEEIKFNPNKHGHRAEINGTQNLRAVHIKLSERV